MSAVDETTLQQVTAASTANWPEESRPITDEEELKLYEMIRSKYGNGPSEDLVIRNVRAFRNTKKGRTEKTMENVEMIVKWRQDIDAGTILKRDLPKADIFYKLWPSALYGEDDLGHVVNFERVLDIQAEEFQKHFDVPAMLLHRAKHMEKIQYEKAMISKRLGRRVYKHIYIFDLKGLSTSHMSKSVMSFLKPIFDLGQVYYPESLYKMFLINAPMVFRGIWKLITPWIDPDTRAKIFVLGGADQFLPEFKKNGIGIDQVPVVLGGTHPGRPLDDSFATEDVSDQATNETSKGSVSTERVTSTLSTLNVSETLPVTSETALPSLKVLEEEKIVVCVNAPPPEKVAVPN